MILQLATTEDSLEAEGKINTNRRTAISSYLAGHEQTKKFPLKTSCIFANEVPFPL